MIRYFLAFAVIITIPRAAVAQTFAKDIRPLLETHCFSCHGPEKQRGKINLATFAEEDALRQNRKLWQRVAMQIKSQEMPPEGQPPLAPAQRELLVKWIEAKILTVDCAMPDPGPTVLRRLNRDEYSRTIRDLFGIEFDAASAVGMAEDPTAQGFDNLANALNLSPSLVEKYFAAAEVILDRLIPPESQGKGPIPGGRPSDKKATEVLLFVKPGNGVTKRDAAKLIMERFARRAYRRPVQVDEVERLLKLFDRADAKAARFEDGVRLMVKAVLVSPHFLMRIEHDRAPAGSREVYRVDDHELAVRLSYFLWSSMPDNVLFALAEAKKLSDPQVFDEQVKRMLADKKARALTDNFAGQWLQIRKLAEARPSTEYFPTFTNKVRQAMAEETRMFFDNLREENRSVLDLLNADYTYLNEDLAKHYGIDGVKGPKMQRVALKASDHRGGILGMGSMLAATSHTSRTSPTLRGKFILEVIFGTPPPPPPPDAGVIQEKPKKGEAPKSFRELLAQHAKNATCAACHNKMDPLGFALDNYDAVGRWRDKQGDQPLDVVGKLPTGETIVGPAELKKLIATRKDAFLRNLTEHMLVYALGRDLEFEDECVLRATLATMHRDDNRFTTLILEIARGTPMLQRRNLGKVKAPG